MKSLPVIFVMMMIVCMAGCSAKYPVNVNGYRDASSTSAIRPGASIFLIEEEKNDNPLFQSEVRQKIEMLLQSKGYTIGPAESAEYQLLFRYGVDSGQTVEGTRLIHEPSRIMTIQRSDNKGGQSYSTIHIPGASYTVPYSKTIFGHWLTLHLYDVPKAETTSGPHKPIWIGEISTHVSSSDLREIVSPMLIAAFEHFGQNTFKRVRENIKTTDPRLRQLDMN